MRVGLAAVMAFAFCVSGAAAHPLLIFNTAGTNRWCPIGDTSCERAPLKVYRQDEAMQRPGGVVSLLQHDLYAVQCVSFFGRDKRGVYATILDLCNDGTAHRIPEHFRRRQRATGAGRYRHDVSRTSEEAIEMIGMKPYVVLWLLFTAYSNGQPSLDTVMVYPVQDECMAQKLLSDRRHARDPWPPYETTCVRYTTGAAAPASHTPPRDRYCKGKPIAKISGEFLGGIFRRRSGPPLIVGSMICGEIGKPGRVLPGTTITASYPNFWSVGGPYVYAVSRSQRTGTEAFYEYPAVGEETR